MRVRAECVLGHDVVIDQHQRIHRRAYVPRLKTPGRKSGPDGNRLTIRRPRYALGIACLLVCSWICCLAHAVPHSFVEIAAQSVLTEQWLAEASKFEINVARMEQ
jgi:hypothetical protein